MAGCVLLVGSRPASTGVLQASTRLQQESVAGVTNDLDYEGRTPLRTCTMDSEGIQTIPGKPHRPSEERLLYGIPRLSTKYTRAYVMNCQITCMI